MVEFLQDRVSSLIRWWWLILASSLIAALTAYVSAAKLPSIHLSRVSVSVEYDATTSGVAPNITPSELLGWASLLETYAQENSSDLMKRAASLQQMTQAGSLSISRTNAILTFSVTSVDQVTANRLANQVAELFISETRTSYPDYVHLNGLQVMDAGRIGPNTALINVMAALGGMVLAMVSAISIESIDTTIKKVDHVKRLTKLPIIGAIGEIERTKVGLSTVTDQPHTGFAEAFRSLRTTLEFASVDKPLKTILVTSAGTGDGKTLIAYNLALIMAQGGKRVFLVDGDLRRPSVHQVAAIPNRDGMSDLFRGHVRIEDVTRPSRDERLSIITGGTPPPNPTELLASKRMDQILFTLGDMADVVIVDGPPFFLADAWILARKVDGMLIIVQLRHSRKNAVRAMMDQLDRLGSLVSILGVVLNRIRADVNYYQQGTYHPQRWSDYYYTVDDIDAIRTPRRSLQSLLRGLQRPAAKAHPVEAETALVPSSTGHGHRLEVRPPTLEAPTSKRSRVSMELLYAISRELANGLELSELLQRLLKMTLESVGASSGSIVVLDEQGEALEGVLIWDEKVQSQTAEQLKDIVERGLAGWVIENRRPVVLDNTFKDGRWLKRQWESYGGPLRQDSKEGSVKVRFAFLWNQALSIQPSS